MRKNFFKKMVAMCATATVLCTALVGCGAKGGDEAKADPAINVISREDGSGTRGAFVELMGVLDSNDKDATVQTAVVTQSTSVMIQSVVDDVNAIGYISLGSLKDNVKAVKVDGVEASVENILSGKYKVARPFNIAYKEDGLSDVAKDFISFVMSEEGQKIVSESGYISEGNKGAYKGSGMKGKLNIAGSTSVAPVMEKIAEAYNEKNPDVTITVTQSGSSAGMKSAIEGACEIGMASRAVKDSEKSQGLTALTIANDGIAVIVNKSNEVSSLTSEQIKKIYLGEATKWSEVK